MSHDQNHGTPQALHALPVLPRQIRKDGTAITSFEMPEAEGCQVTKALKRIIREALDSMVGATRLEIAKAIKESAPEEIDGFNWDCLLSVVKRMENKRHKSELKANPAQAWLELPDLKDFQYIPVIVRKDSLEDYRERIKLKEREIEAYKRSRLSIQNERIAKRELREMKRLEPLISPYFADDPSMDVERAIELYRQERKSATYQKGKTRLKIARSRRRKG